MNKNLFFTVWTQKQVWRTTKSDARDTVTYIKKYRNMDGGGRMDRWTEVRPWKQIANTSIVAIWRENGINRSGPSGLMAFIRCYSRDEIGILVVSTEGWLLCKKISENLELILAIRQIVQKSKRIFHDEWCRSLWWGK